MPTRVMCDTQVHDAVAADPQLKQVIEQRQAAGQISVSTTHIQIDQLAKIPATRDIGQAGAIAAERVGTGVFVLGHSRLSEDRLGDATLNATYTQLQKGNARHTEDAMIGATAVLEADILVTEDKTFRSRFKALGTNAQVMSVQEFATYLASLPPLAV
jgi:predicted nucleic acid-binding protein